MCLLKGGNLPADFFSNFILIGRAMASIIRYSITFLAVVFFATFGIASEKKQKETGAPLSPQTQACITCTRRILPVIEPVMMKSSASSFQAGT